MFVLLDRIGDYLLADTPGPLAFLLRLPIHALVAFCLVWIFVRAVVLALAICMPPISRMVAHAVWYVLLWPEALLSKQAAKHSRAPSGALYVYGHQVEHLAIAVRTAFRYLGRMLVSVSRTPLFVLVMISLAWAVLSLVVDV